MSAPASAVVAWANFGAEEASAAGPAGANGERSAAPRARVAAVLRRLATLWHALFSPDAHLEVPPPGLAPAALDPWVEQLPHGGPAFPWLAGPGLWPWLSTPAAAARARALGVVLRGAPPDVVTRTHDKAFAATEAAALGLVPAALDGLVVVLEPDALTRAQVEARVASWPAAARARFTLKPRWGTSGRGRIAGVDGRLATGTDAELARLALRGGAILEPWLDRTLDLSSQWHIDDDGRPALLGSTVQLVSGAGVWLGSSFVCGPQGPRAGTPWDAALEAAALALVARAAAVGLRGPCGVDALVFRGNDGSEVLRPLLELNARFTSGTVALGIARRAGLAVGARAVFRLADHPPLTSS